MSRFFLNLFVFFLAWMRKLKRRKREKEREKIYHIITMMMFFFSREIYDRKGTRQRKSALMERF